MALRDFERRNLILEANPWWRNASRWTERDQDLRAARGNGLSGYAPRPLHELRQGALELLMGPRRVGKSVAMKRAIVDLIDDGVDPKRITFCPCESLTGQDLRRVVKLATDLTPGFAAEERFWFFDEITYIPRWDETLKQLRDQTALREAAVIATGSSGAKLRHAQGQLGGREGGGGTRFMWPMGFRPFVRALYPDLDASLPVDRAPPTELQSDAIRRHLREFAIFVDDLALAWERYLAIGGFPLSVADALSEVDVRRETAISLWNILVGDVLRVGNMSDRDVKALLTRLVSGLGAPLSVNTIARQLSIGTRNTVDDRIDRLCASFYGWRASTTHDGHVAVPGGQSKFYFVDPVIARLPSLRDQAIPQPDVTYLSEQQVGTALIRVVSETEHPAIMDEAAVLVRRTESGAEIDFVGDVIDTPIECKYVSRAWKRERRGLDEQYQRGIVATRDVLDTGDHIWAVPAAVLVWIIDG